MKITPEMIIALCALGFTVYQAWLTRRHNPLAVMPHLDWSRARRRDENGLALRLLLKNTGIGPAIIQRRAFFFNGATISVTGNDLIENSLLAVLLTS